MKLFELFENLNQQDPVVIIGGRFQPFHKGHYGCYKLLVNKFGKDNVFIATSNKTNFESALGKISPLTFQEKQSFINAIYNIDSSKIVETTNPLYFPKEIIKIAGADRIYIQATGIKNINRYESNAKIKQYEMSDDKLSSNDNQYNYITIPPQSNGISASEIRNKLLNQKTEKEIQTVFHEIFGKYDETQCNMLMTALKKVKA